MISRFFFVLATIAGIFFLTAQTTHAETLADTYTSKKTQKNFSTRDYNDLKNYDHETLTKEMHAQDRKAARKKSKYKNPRKNRRETKEQRRKQSRVNSGVNE